MVDLNTRIDPALNWMLVNALAINDAGQILVTDMLTARHGVLANPRAGAKHIDA
jgi:hypothetical protein